MNILRNHLRQALVVKPRPDGSGFAANLSLETDFAGFAGHFPGAPVLPGICLITASLLAAGQTRQRTCRLSRIRNCKFFSPVAPGQAISFEGRIGQPDDRGEYRIDVDVACEDRKVASLRLLARDLP